MEHILSFIIKYGALLGILLLPIREALIVVMCLTFADMIVGVWASLKEGYKITSRSLRRTISKIFVYQISIIVAFFIETYLVQYPITKVITGLIGIVEGKSFFENLYRISGVDLLRIIIDKFQLIYDNIKPTSSKDEIKPYKGKNNNEK